MLSEMLLWTFLTTASLLIVHEIDSAFWKEWELFRLPFGHQGFILIHVPLVLVLLWGAVQVAEGSPFGGVICALVSAGGLFAFSIHSYFLREGHTEFAAPASRAILWALLLGSLVLAGETTVWVVLS